MSLAMSCGYLDAGKDTKLLKKRGFNMRWLSWQAMSVRPCPYAITVPLTPRITASTTGAAAKREGQSVGGCLV